VNQICHEHSETQTSREKKKKQKKKHKACGTKTVSTIKRKHPISKGFARFGIAKYVFAQIGSFLFAGNGRADIGLRQNGMRSNRPSTKLVSLKLALADIASRSNWFAESGFAQFDRHDVPTTVPVTWVPL